MGLSKESLEKRRARLCTAGGDCMFRFGGLRGIVGTFRNLI